MAEEQIDDRRAALEEAFDKAEAAENPNPDPVEAAAEDPPAAPAAPEPPATDGTPPEPGVEVEETPTEPAPEAEPETEPTPEPAAEPAAAEIAAPVGWRGGAKQHWDKLPAEVKAEVDKREREIGGALREAAEVRQFKSQFDQVIDPFKGLIAAKGADPLQATQAMLQTHAALTLGTPAQKAQTIAKAIQEYGVDIEALASAIDGQPGEGAPGNGAGAVDPAMQAWIEQQLAPVRDFAASLKQREQQEAEQVQREAATDIDTFAADPKNIYFADVQNTMGDLLEVAGRQGRKMSLQQAYDAAVRMDPELSKRYQAPQPGNGGSVPNAAARRAAAASSIAPKAQPAAMPEPKDRREAIAQSIDKLSGGSV